MPNATPRDTRAGWEIFLESDEWITLEDLNDELLATGFGPISERTFRHYHQLYAAGYTRYISINRFDVARASEPYGNSSSKGRYSYRSSDATVDVTFVKPDRLLEVSGRATEVGDVGAVVMFDGTEVERSLTRLRPTIGEPVVIRFVEAGQTIMGRITKVDLSSFPARIEVEYRNLMS